MYTVTENGQPVRAGDTVHNFRGELGTFERATRAPVGYNPNTGAPIGNDGKVIVDGREYYARVWYLKVTQDSRPGAR